MGKALAEEGIDAEVSGRPKHFYSIFRKMENQSLDFDQVYDLVAFRIVVDTMRECYEAMGVVHAKWRPVPGRFKDYIALAKPNMYQSLHTTVIGPNAQRIEIQIRTHEMHRVAEEGIASHWRYKKGQDLQVTDMQRFAWLRQLLEWQQNLSDPQEFLHSIKEDLFPDEVYVFTPNGDVQSFPKGATVVDFAYRIHSDIGQHCSGARVNGRLVPFKYILRSGDTVEIITTQEQTPSRDWLKVVKTPRAKSRIRAWMASQQRERSVALGREILEGDFNRHELDYQDLQARGTIDALGKELGVKNEEGLLASVGYGKVMSGQVLARLLPAEKLQGDKKQLEGGLERLFRLVGSRGPGGPRQGHRGCAGAFRALLPSAARRRDRRDHYPRARRDRARSELSHRTRSGSRKKGGGELVGGCADASWGEDRGELRGRTRPPGRHQLGDLGSGSEHRPRSHTYVRRQGRQHVRDHDRKAPISCVRCYRTSPG